MLIALRIDKFLSALNEEKRVVDEVCSDNKSFARLLYYGVLHIWQNEVGAEVSARHNHHLVARPKRLIGDVANVLRHRCISIEEERFDIFDYVVHCAGTLIIVQLIR